MSRPQDLIRYAPLGRLPARKKLVMEVHRIAPVIHIAHRRLGPLQSNERIIFDHELVLVLKGRGRFRIGKTEYAYSPHDLFFIPPFVSHEIQCDGSADHVAIHFDFSAARLAATPSRRKPYEIAFSHDLSISTRIAVQPDDRIEEGCLAVVRSFSAIDPLASLEASAELSKLLIRLLRLRPVPVGEGGGQGRLQRMVESVIAYVESRVREKLASSDLAAHAGLSETHLNRVFRHQTGYAPMEYVRRYRVQQAKVLLGDADLSVKEVAVRTGFDDAYHFSRVFRQIAGVPPTAYRDALFSRQTSNFHSGRS